jgi:hypothetical protein
MKTDQVATLLSLASQEELITLFRMSNRVLQPKAAAAYLGVSIRCLEDWRKRHVGPKWKKYGKRIVYRAHDVEAYFEQGDPSPTPDSSAP